MSQYELPPVFTMVYYLCKDRAGKPIWERGRIIRQRYDFLPPSVWVRSSMSSDHRYLKITDLGLKWWIGTPVTCWADVHALWEKNLTSESYDK